MPRIFSGDQAERRENGGQRAETDDPERRRCRESPRMDVSPTWTQGRNALTANTTPATSGTMYARMPGRNIARKLIGRV